MKELNRTDRLTIATILVAIILVIGLVTIKKPEVQYKYGIDETLSMILSSDDVISPAEIAGLISQNSGGFLLVDVRSPLDYQKSHIENAVNIPSQELLDRKNLKAFSRLSDESKTVILYGQDQLDANGAWMVLKQVGYKNIRVLSGGYEHFSSLEMNPAASALPDYKAEKPVVNYQEELKKLGTPETSAGSDKPEPIKVIKREKKTAAEGGC